MTEDLLLMTNTALMKSALSEAGFITPIIFGENDTDREEIDLVWNHKTGRVTLYVEDNGDFTIEEVPYSDFKDVVVSTVSEAVEVMERYPHLKTYANLSESPEIMDIADSKKRFTLQEVEEILNVHPRLIKLHVDNDVLTTHLDADKNIYVTSEDLKDYASRRAAATKYVNEILEKGSSRS